MTNNIKLFKDKYSHWIEFEDTEDTGRSLEASVFTEGVEFTIYGRTYLDRDNYRVTPLEDLQLDLEDIKRLRDFLNESIEAMENHVE